jgi:hypothetical protein
MVEASDFVGYFEKEMEPFHVYPNPTTDYLKFSHELNTVKVYSLSGQLLLSSDTDWLDVRDLEAGTYILEGGNSEHTFRTTFIKK